MLRIIRKRLQSEKGFTLIELLVVILIIGILAAIALPAFLGQREKGQDSAAKANARNMVSQVESCYTDTQNYNQCKTGDPALETGGVPTSGPQAVSVTLEGTDGYEVNALSQSSGRFLITKASAGATPSRTCTGDTGGCNNDSW